MFHFELFIQILISVCILLYLASFLTLCLWDSSLLETPEVCSFVLLNRIPLKDYTAIFFSIALLMNN